MIGIQRKLLFCIVTFMLFACAKQPVQSTIYETVETTETLDIEIPTKIPTEIKIDVTNTPEFVETPTVKTSGTEQEERWFTNDLIPAGEYLFLNTYDDASNRLEPYIVSIETGEKIPIAYDYLVQVIGNNGFVKHSVFNDSTEEYEVISYRWLNNLDEKIENLPDCWYRDISLDGRYLLATSCNQDNDQYDGINLFVYDRVDEELIQLTYEDKNSEGYRYFCNPAFSPDGKWISYTDTPLGFTPEFDEKHGLYLLSTDCITNPTTCDDVAIGPFQNEDMALSDGFSRYSWSPDSQKIAFPGLGEFDILIFDLQSENIDGTIIPTDHEYGVEMLDWTADGKWMLYHLFIQKGDVYLYNLETQEVKVITTTTNTSFFAQLIVIE